MMRTEFTSARIPRLLLCFLVGWVAGIPSSVLAQDLAPPEAEAGKPSEEAEAVDPFVVVEGQVTTSMGGGEEGVSVSVHHKNEDGSAGELIGTAGTDAMGDFKITAREPFRGEIVVRLSKPLYIDLVRAFELNGEAYPPYLAESMEGSVVVIGRVVDALTEAPLTDTGVTLEAVERNWKATTDDAGRFSIKGVLPGEGALIVEAKGYGREKRSVARLEDFGEILIRVKPERIVRVKVKSEDDEPIAQATVEILDQYRDDFRAGVTDDEGVAVFRGLHFDARRIIARLTHDGYVSSPGFERTLSLPEKEVESTHRLEMARAAILQGRITHSETGEPLYGARIMTGDGQSNSSARDWADHEGRYTVRGVPAGPVIVTVHLSGYAPDLKRIDANAGEPTELDVQLTEGARLTGVVKNEEGKPVAGAFVDATTWREASTLGLRAVTDSGGRFVIESAPHDAFEIVVYGRRSKEVKREVQVGKDEPLVLTIPSGPALDEETGAPQIVVGDKAPSLNLTTLKGEKIDLAKWKGKLMVLDFWATWCGPCVGDLPHLHETFAKYGKRADFAMVSVSLDDDEKALRAFIASKEMTWHQVFGESGGAQLAADQYGVVGIPAVFLIGKDGKVVACDVGGDELLEVVGEHLKGEATRDK